MTVRTMLRSTLAAALAAAALLASAPAVLACGQWEETDEKILAFDGDGTRALVLVTTRRYDYSGTSVHHRLFVVDRDARRPDDSPLGMEGLAEELPLTARERRMAAETLEARIVRRLAQRFPFRSV